MTNEAQASGRRWVGWALAGAAVGVVLLGAVAIPAYNHYPVRSRTVELLTAAGELRMPIAEFHAAHQRLPIASEAVRFTQKFTTGRVDSVYFDAATSAIVAVADMRSDSRLHGKRVALVAKASPEGIEWTCKTVDVEPQNMPSSCREIHRLP